MTDTITKIREKFKKSNRYANFGDVLMGMTVRGFRGHKDTIIEIKNPITAFSGLNGTGKSTLLQLSAIAFSRIDERDRDYNVEDFFHHTPVDIPFAKNASIKYRFSQNVEKDEDSDSIVAISYEDGKRWSGYDQRPKRFVFFAGVSFYLPKNEERDNKFRYDYGYGYTDSMDVKERVRVYTSRILSHNFSEAKQNELYDGSATPLLVESILSLKRSEAVYSEANMGFGEGRTFKLIKAIEELPQKSLILLEEPEASLHPSAQYKFAKYLIDVSIEKGHQIILATHSEYILDALPSESRIFLHKPDDGVVVIPGITSSQAISLMTEGRKKSLHILVEDECAKEILCEIIRREDPQFLEAVGIFIGGDKINIERAMKAISETKLPIVAVRDADTGGDLSSNILKLPGSQAPEKELFENLEVRDYISKTYKINFDDFACLYSDHHEWPKQLAFKVSENETALIGELSRVYAASINETELVKSLKKAMRTP
jgi:predicted ATPase